MGPVIKVTNTPWGGKLYTHYIDAQDNVLEIVTDLRQPAVDPVPTPELSNKKFVIFPDIQFPAIGTNIDATDLLLKYKQPIDDVVDVNYPATILIKRIVKDAAGKTTLSFPFRTNKFIITGVTKKMEEKYQIVETFGLPSLFFFDQRVSIYSIQGVLMDSFFARADTDPDTVGDSLFTDENVNNKYMWTQAFQKFYNDELRATQLVAKNSVGILAVDNYMVEGYPVILNILKDSQQFNNATRFEMAWIVTKETRLADAKGIDQIYKPTTVKDKALAYERELFDILNKIQVLDDKYNNLAYLGLEYDEEEAQAKDILKQQDVLRKQYTAKLQTIATDYKFPFASKFNASEWD